MAKELIVFTLDMQESRRIVAAPNKTQAALLLETSKYLLETYGGTTEAESETQTALSDPGAVWERHSDSSEWVKKSSSRKANSLPSQGGYRPGSGRPLSGATPIKPRAISVDDALWATFIQRGGTRFLRQVLASGIDLNQKEWSVLDELGGNRWLRQQLKDAKRQKD